MIAVREWRKAFETRETLSKAQIHSTSQYRFDRKKRLNWGGEAARLTFDHGLKGGFGLRCIKIESRIMKAWLHCCFHLSVLCQLV